MSRPRSAALLACALLTTVVGLATPVGASHPMAAQSGPVGTPPDAPSRVTTAAGPQATGYALVGADGAVTGFGSASFLTTPTAPGRNAAVVAGALTPSADGVWQVSADGGLFTAGDAAFLGSTGGVVLNRPIVGMAATPSGQGYWLVATDGGIFSFGDASFFGSTGDVVLNRPIVGIAATPSGRGYWLVASDGGIFSFGDASFFGSTGDVVLNRPIVGIAATPSGRGYWLVASDGGIFSFGDASFFGSTGDVVLNQPIATMAPTPAGDGYWLVARDGGVFTFGAAPFLGSGARAFGGPDVVAIGVSDAVVDPFRVPTYSTTLLGEGVADMYPVDIADTPTHYYVVDPGRYSVFKIDRTSGAVVATAGGHQGDAPEQFAAARAIATDADANVYVADTPNNRVSKWDRDLHWVANFGRRGTGDGEFTQVYGVAVGTDATGQQVLYAVDGAGKVETFTLDGTWLSTFGSGVLNQPRQLTVHPNRDVYVVSARDRQVVVFGPDGIEKHRFGGTGDGPGEFSGDPRGIAISPGGGTVFVTDEGNGRVQAFHAYDGLANPDGLPDGSYWYEVGSLGTGPGQFVDARGVTVTDDGLLVVTDEWDHALKEFSLVNQPNETFVRTLFGGGPPAHGVNSPRGLAYGANGRLYVSDWWNQRIVHVRDDGSGFAAWGQRGIRSELGTLNFVWGVAVEPGTGRVFVANRESHEIEVFDSDGTPVVDWSQRGTTDGLLTFPQGITFDPTDGTLLVADSGNDRIQRFRIGPDGVGTWMTTYGSAGAEVGQFNTPTGIDVAADGTIWVADTLNNRIQQREPATGVWTAFRKAGNASAYETPWGVTVAPDGAIWVADSGNDRIVKGSSTGGLYFTATGPQLGTSALDAPFGIEFGPDRQIWVSDTWNNRVIELTRG